MKKIVRLMRPTEWALEEKIDPCLFMYWKNKLVTIKEFNELKLRVGIKTIGGTKC